MTVKSSI